MSRTRPLLALGVAASALALSGCVINLRAPAAPAPASSSVAPSQPVATVVVTTTVPSDSGSTTVVTTAAAPAPAAPAPAAPAATRRELGRRGSKDYVDNKFDGWGGPVPAGAVSAPSSKGACLITSPTKNLMCEVSSTGEAGCGALSWIRSEQFGREPIGARWWLRMSTEGVGEPRTKTDAPEADDLGSSSVVPYGRVVVCGEWVAHSGYHGITMWSSRSGHGLFINAHGYTWF